MSSNTVFFLFPFIANWKKWISRWSRYISYFPRHLGLYFCSVCFWFILFLSVFFCLLWVFPFGWTAAPLSSSSAKSCFLLSRQAQIYSYCHTCRNLTHVVFSILRILHQESILPLFYFLRFSSVENGQSFPLQCFKPISNYIWTMPQL